MPVIITKASLVLIGFTAVLSAGCNNDSGGTTAADLALAIDVNFPTANANIGDVDTLTVSGRIRGLGDDDAVSASDLNFIDVNGSLATSELNNPGLWTASGLDTAQSQGVKVTATVESAAGNTDIKNLDLTKNALFNSPGDLALDAAKSRILLMDRNYKALIALDQATGTRTILSDSRHGSGPDLNVPGSFAVDATGNRALAVDISADPDGEPGPPVVVAIHLDTGNRTILSSTDRGDGPEFTRLSAIAVDAAKNRAIVNHIYIGVDQKVEGALIAVDLDTGDRTLISGKDQGSGPEFNPDLPAITLDADNNRYLVIDYDQANKTSTLMAVDIDSGNRSILSGSGPSDTLEGNGPNFSYPRSLSLDRSGKRALLIDRGGFELFSVDLETGDRTVLSDNTEGSGKNFYLPDVVVFDADHERALVGQSRLNGLFSVDLDTGVRTIDFSISSGSGQAFSRPKSIVLDADHNRVLVANFGKDALIGVDIETGTRSLLSGSSKGRGPDFGDVTSITLDNANRRILVVDIELEALVAVNPKTGDRTILSDTLNGSGPELALPLSVTLDESNNRVLVADADNLRASLNRLIAIDLTSGNRTIVSDADTGGGPDFAFPGSITLDRENNRALVVDYETTALIGVDLTNGDRTTISDASTGAGPDLIAPRTVTLDSTKNRVLIGHNEFGAAALFAVNLTTGKRTIVSDRNTGSGPSFATLDSIALDAPNNRAFGIDSDSQALFIINLAPGTDADRAIVSM